MTDPLETSELLAFARTVEAQSLSRAASELGLPRATVSRRLQRMEQRLGVRLIRRTTRSLALTDAGEALYRRAAAIVEAVRDAERSVSMLDDRVRGRLRVSIPPTLPPSFQDLVCSFLIRYPEVRLELEASARHVDLIAEGFDVALRAGAAIDSGLVGRILKRESMRAVAAPSYLKARGTPRSARELSRHACLTGFMRGEVPQTHWPLRKRGSIRIEGLFSSNDVQALLAAARRGLGIALLPSLISTPFVERGELVTVLERIVGADAQLMLVYPERQLMPPAVRAFIDAVAPWAEAELTVTRCREAVGSR
jgi:DNA-binding transcriptional LysR family regulator